jgi:hypothetical protein
MVSDASPDFCSLDLSDNRRTCQYNESGQKEDTEKCIKSVVNTNRMMQRWTSEHKQLVIDVLSKKNGRHGDVRHSYIHILYLHSYLISLRLSLARLRFRWVYCQLGYLRNASQAFPAYPGRIT